MSVPFVTIIMPIRNEAAFMAYSLRALLVQNYPLERMEAMACS
jgi:glycosyltransferase involved in cell wall biosynthesis